MDIEKVTNEVIRRLSEKIKIEQEQNNKIEKKFFLQSDCSVVSIPGYTPIPLEESKDLKKIPYKTWQVCHACFRIWRTGCVRYLYGSSYALRTCLCNHDNSDIPSGRSRLIKNLSERKNSAAWMDWNCTVYHWISDYKLDAAIRGCIPTFLSWCSIGIGYCFGLVLGSGYLYSRYGLY